MNDVEELENFVEEVEATETPVLTEKDVELLKVALVIE